MRRGRNRIRNSGYGKNATNSQREGGVDVIGKAFWALTSFVVNDLLSDNSKIKKIGQKMVAKLSVTPKKTNKEITNAKYKVIEGDKK